ncbi:hypothetical protein ACFE04_027256 [Oxalis oulophora]
MSTSFVSSISRENQEISDLLKRLNKPAVKTIKSADGDIIDCVKLADQPAFDHPLLKNHTIQLSPTTYPAMWNSANQNKQRKPFTQLWQLSGTCPNGTIPILRTKKSDILRASSIEAFGKKNQSTLLPPFSQRNAPGVHEYAAGFTNPGSGKYYGTQADLSVWNPHVDRNTEFSLSQVWIIGGNPIVETIEVYPNINGDANTRFFIYWTRDDYKQTGCYNLKCPGFVQTNPNVAIGATISPVSTYDGELTALRVVVWLDANSRNWWLMAGEDFIGYWPTSLFHNFLTSSADVISWGGEIINEKDGSMHTRTEMGSGHFSGEGARKACYVSNILVLDNPNSRSMIEPSEIKAGLTNPGCYDIATDRLEGWGLHFFFGGPGRNPNCL